MLSESLPDSPPSLDDIPFRQSSCSVLWHTVSYTRLSADKICLLQILLLAGFSTFSQVFSKDRKSLFAEHPCSYTYLNLMTIILRLQAWITFDDCRQKCLLHFCNFCHLFLHCCRNTSFHILDLPQHIDEILLRNRFSLLCIIIISRNL